MKRDERLQLNNLSKLLYGSSSKWQKMINKGEVTTLKRTLEDGTEEKYQGYSYYTADEIKITMQDLWKEEQERIKSEEAVEAAKEVIAQQSEVLEKLSE